MKKLLAILLCLMLLLTACGTQTPGGTDAPGCNHADSDDNGVCDSCSASVLVLLDFFVLNDLHGKIADGDTQPGVDELTTYLKQARANNSNMFLLSSGDMWQGSAESNLTGGLLVTDWMNYIEFDAMALGNHEYDWGESKVEANAEQAQFPFLAINVYDRETGKQAEYCQSSLLIDRGGIQVGVIGAIGDCYSSISAEQSGGFYFKVGEDLTQLVMAESESLRQQGADLIVYLLHDGYEQSGAKPTEVPGHRLANYYDTDLSDGYVDLVFEGHTHQRYILIDEYGVYHLQSGGENQNISQVQISINSVTGSYSIVDAGLIRSDEYAKCEDDPIVNELLSKHAETISPAMRIVGYNARRRKSNELQQYVADQYYKVGVEYWGDEYDIVLGGGFISVRSPYELPAGEVSYGQLQMLFPFDNELVLCSVKGRDLLDKFFETDNSRYYIAYGEYGQQVWQNIDLNATYYIVVDSYTSVYAPNRLTEVERYTPGVYARDLLADFILSGGMHK